jgi:hypothetical protein
MHIPARAMRCALFAALLLAPSAAFAQVQINQTFVPQGPAPATNSNYGYTDSGAVQAVMPDPTLGPDTYFIGATNGGIWVTTDGGKSWKPLTDNQASLSIASLSLDPTDPTGKTLIAGIGITSNGLWGPGVAGRGDPPFSIPTMVASLGARLGTRHSAVKVWSASPPVAMRS